MDAKVVMYVHVEEILTKIPSLFVTPRLLIYPTDITTSSELRFSSEI